MRKTLKTALFWSQITLFVCALFVIKTQWKTFVEQVSTFQTTEPLENLQLELKGVFLEGTHVWAEKGILYTLLDEDIEIFWENYSNMTEKSISDLREKFLNAEIPLLIEVYDQEITTSARRSIVTIEEMKSHCSSQEQIILSYENQEVRQYELFIP